MQIIKQNKTEIKLCSHFIHDNDKVGWDIKKLKTDLKLTQILERKPNPTYPNYAETKPVPKILDLLSSLSSTLFYN